MSYKKFVCWGGMVRSSDGDRHQISASRVALLHNLNPNKCILINNEADEHKLRGWHPEDFYHLSPRNDGNYEDLRGLQE